MIITLGISAGIFRHYYEVDEQDRKRLLFSGIISQTIIIGSIIAIIFLFIDRISIEIFASDQYAYILKLALVQLFIVELFEHFMTLLRYQKKPQLFLKISSIQIALNLFFLLFYVAYLKLGIPGVYYGIITAYLFPLSILVLKQYKYYSLNLDLRYVKQCLLFSVPLIPGWFVNMYLARSNKFFLQSFHSLDQVGLFSISEKIAGIVALFMTVFFMAWNPMSMELINQKSKHHLYDSIGRLFLFCASVLVLGITFFSKEVLIILTTETYFSAYKYAGLIAFGTLTFYLNYFLGQGIIIAKKTVYQSLARLFGALVATMLFLKLIPVYSGYGATIGTIAGYATASLLMIIFSERLYHIPFDLKRIAAAYIFTLLMITAYLISSTENTELSFIPIAIKVGVVAISTVILAGITFNSTERKKIYTYINENIKLSKWVILFKNSR